MYSNSAVKLGVFFCTCGHMMNDYFDMKLLRNYANTLDSVSYVDENPSLCTSSGLEWLKTKILQSGCNRVVIAGCSPYSFESNFMDVLEQAGLNRYFLAIANIREGCAWVTREKSDLEPRARQILKSAVRRALVAKPVEKVKKRVNPSALVIGAGLAGIQTALELRRLGIKPIVIEKAAQVSLKNHPVLSPQGADEQKMFSAKLQELQDENIEFLTSTELKDLDGGVGSFGITLESAGKEKSLEVGSIVVSTDFQSQERVFKSSPRMVSLSRLQAMLTDEPKSLDRIMITKDKRTKYVCFILGEFETFTKTATITALNEAIALKKRFKAEVLILTRDMAVSGTQMEAAYRQARQAGILFGRYTDKFPPQVSVEKGVITVQVKDPFLAGPTTDDEAGGQTICVNTDLLVFEDEIMPAEGTEILKDTLQINLNEGGFYQEKNIHLKPNLSNKKGIFLAGSCHGEKDIYETLNDVRSVAMSVYSLLSREYLEVEQKTVINTDKCVLCLTCIRSCPHRAIEVGRVDADQKWGARVIVEACQGCGICAGECPAKAIEMVNYSDKQIFAELSF